MKTLYVHLGWDMPYPFSPRYWSQKEWDRWVSLISKAGIERLMVWPGLEFILIYEANEWTEFRERVRRITAACSKHGLQVWMGRSANGVCLKSSVSQNRRSVKDIEYIHPDSAQFDDCILRPISDIFSDELRPHGWWVIDRDPGDSFDTKPNTFSRILSNQTKAAGAELSIHWMWAGWTKELNQPSDWREKPQEFWIEAIKSCQEEIGENLRHLACWPGHLKALEQCRARGFFFPYHFLEGEPSLPYSYHKSEKNCSFGSADSLSDISVLNIQTPCLRTPHLIRLLQGKSNASTTWEEIEDTWCWSKESLETIHQPWKEISESLANKSRNLDAITRWSRLFSSSPPPKRGVLVDHFPLS